MLRRFSAAISRTAPFAALNFAAPFKAVAQRDVAVFSESDPVLLNNAKARTFKSNLWVEDTDAYWTDKLSKVKAGEKPTKVKVQRRFELLNADQLQNVPAHLRQQTPPSHTSVKSQKPYGDAMQKKLEEYALVNNLTSKWWVTTGEARKNSWLIKERQRPYVAFFKSDANLFNADQFENPDAINGQTFSGASRKPFSLEMHAKLSAHMKANGFKSGLFFSEKQTAELGLAVKPAAAGVQLDIAGGDSFVLYNIDQVINWNAVVDELQRFPVNEPTFLTSGRTLNTEFRAAVDGDAKNHQSNYWVTKRDIDSHKWALKPDAKGSAVPPKYRGFKMFNVYELHDPEHAFKICGSPVQQ